MSEQTEIWMTQIADWAVGAGTNIVGALAILIVGYLVAGWAHSLTRRGLDRNGRIDSTLRPLIANTIRYAILAFVVVAVLAQFGIQTASIIAVLGTIGLAIGLAMQGTLSNVAAGFMLLLLRPLRVGEYIDADGVAGTVVEVGLFATELRTFDGVYLHVPNGTLLGRAIKNFSRNPTRRLDVKVGISYDDDIDKAMEVARRVLAAEQRLLPDPAPEVMVVELGDSSVNINLRGWVKGPDYFGVLFDLTRTIKQRLEAEGLTIPFPQRDLHIIDHKEKAAG